MKIVSDLEANDISIPELTKMIYKARQNSELRDNDRSIESIEKGLPDFLKNYKSIIARSEETNELIGWLGVSFGFIDERAVIAGGWMPIVLPIPGQEENAIASELIQAAKKLVGKYRKELLNVYFPRYTAELAPFFRKTREWYLSQGIEPMAEHIYMECELLGRDMTDPELPEGYTVSPLTSTDIDDLYNCYYETMITGNDRIFLAEREEHRRHFFIVLYDRNEPGINEEASLALVKDGDIVGYCQVHSGWGMKGQEELSFGIHPDHRRKGLGKSLLTMSMNRVAKQGKNMCLEVDTENPVAIHLYESLGFKEAARLGSCTWRAKVTIER
ncbi:MAG: GNAT family N-acetyltransferase [Candidatus Odinarchaeota archaeon]